MEAETWLVPRSYNDPEDVNTVLLHDETDGAFIADVPDAAGSDDEGGGVDSEVDVSSDEESDGEEEEEEEEEEGASPKRCALSPECAWSMGVRTAKRAELHRKGTLSKIARNPGM